MDLYNFLIFFILEHNMSRRKILGMSKEKLSEINDAAECLRRAVLIRNTYINAKLMKELL